MLWVDPTKNSLQTIVASYRPGRYHFAFWPTSAAAPGRRGGFRKQGAVAGVDMAMVDFAVPGTTAWMPAHLAQLRVTPETTLPAIPADLTRPLFPGLDLWDMWPLQEQGGHAALIGGSHWWFILAAPTLPDPDDRHAIARIRLVEQREGNWIDHGNAFPDGFTPGSREWAGSAVRRPDSLALDLYFTAAGRSGDGATSWEQRIFACAGLLSAEAAKAGIVWQAPEEIIVADDRLYQRVDANSGRAGFIKGFRDPAWFVDPADGLEYLLFTASLVDAGSEYDGAIGWARRSADGHWRLLPPLVTMDGINNEPERPHVVAHEGRYYLFFSTQRRMFAPGVAAGPNGLYGLVADQLTGPWRPLNGSGLVAANPAGAPLQAYSWWVTAALDVHGFADLPGVAEVPADADACWRRAHFGGVPAPVFRLALDGAASRLIA